MFKICVLDVAASTGGAITVLNSFYQEAKKNDDIEWHFLLSTHKLEETENIHTHNFDWIKKSRVHRIFFDHFVSKKVLERIKPDMVLSLQNICIKTKKYRQIVYVHQSIPFCEYQFRLKQSPIEWLYQNIIAKEIYRSIHISQKVIVQTEWMKKAVIDKTKVDENKILVSRPDCNITVKEQYTDTEYARRRFFYPAPLVSYKNHKVIHDAIKLLNERGITDFEVLLTIDSKESFFDCKQVTPMGSIPYNDVLNLYTCSTLLFPSKLETFGLPLLEAGKVGARIIAADLPYSREVLKNYSNVIFFMPDSASRLAEVMQGIIYNDIKYEEDNRMWQQLGDNNTGWSPVIKMLKHFKTTKREENVNEH